MSEIRLPLVVELDYQKLDQLNERFEESKKRLLDLAKLTKSGFAETCKQLGKVDETLLNMQSSLTELNGQLLKSSLSSKDIFSGAIDSSIGLTASIAYLTETSQRFGESMAGWAAIGTAAGIGLKAAFDAWSNSSLKAMSETAKIANEQDRILDALKATAKEGNAESQMLLQKLSGLVKYYGDSEKALKVFMSTERLYYDQMIKITDAYHKEKDAAKEAADTKKYLSLLFGGLTSASDELISKTGELSKTNADLYSVMDKYGVTSLTKLNDETKTLLSEYDLMQANTTMNVALTEQFADAVAALIEKYRMLGKDAPAALDELYYKSTIHKQLLENIPLRRDYSDLVLVPAVKQPEVDWTQEFLANAPIPKTNYDLLLSNSGGASKGDAAKGSGFFGGMKESFQSEWKAMKKSFGIGGDKGMLGNLFGGKGTGGGLLGMLGSLAGPQEGILGTMQKFASMIPGIGGMISNIIGGIGTAFNALKSLFGGLRRDIKGLIKYVCYRNYTNFLYKQCFFSFEML